MTAKYFDEFAARCVSLEAPLRHIFQLLAVVDEPLSRIDTLELSKATGWVDHRGKPLNSKTIGPIVNELWDQGFLEKGAYNSCQVNPALLDLAIQDSLRQGTFPSLWAAVEAWTSRRRYGASYSHRNLRRAFYEGNVQLVDTILRNRRLGEVVTVLYPFDAQLFDQLDAALQEMYLADLIPSIIANPHRNQGQLTKFDEWIATQSSSPPVLLNAQLDLAIARGDLPVLERLNQQTGEKLGELKGCLLFLRGDFDAARNLLAQVFLGKKRKSPLTPIAHLPAILFLVLLLKEGTGSAYQEAATVITAASKARRGRYLNVIDLIAVATRFRQSPKSPNQFAAVVKTASHGPLEMLFAGYFAHWLLQESDAPSPVTGLANTGTTFQNCGLDWLAAEAFGLASHSPDSSVGGEGQTHEKACAEIHARLGTTSLVGLIEQEPIWLQALSAIAKLGEEVTPTREATSQSDRLIWELCTGYSGISLEAFHQQRKGGGWSKGRKIGRHRLHDQFAQPEFAFFTDQDRAICRTLQMSVDRNHYGYTETSYFYNEARAARAIIGHPCIFAEGERDSPLEIVEQAPKLTVVEDNEDHIRLFLDPQPIQGQKAFRVIEDGPRRLAIVFFSDQHLKLHQILDGQLKVPRSAARKVVEAIQPLASLVTVQSEIGGETEKGVQVEAIPQIHVHLLPLQDGLRIEFFVRPFGEEGPFCRPGQGGANLFATVNGRQLMAKRDLDKERTSLDELLSACPEIAARLESDHSVSLPTPIEALEALLQLEDLVNAKQIELHWPQGRSLQLAGRATESQFRLHIRKDHDWFAASGDVVVNRDLSLDLMKLIDLVEASPGRFVKLDDGRFLALTQQLRERVEELATYGDRRSQQNKLRFPPLRAVALEDMAQSVQLKSDKHWKDWVLRMRQASELTPEVPSTLQTQLRDYQIEGFQWLARLAAWGVGGCLADDMGLGKTLQALALLLHRASGGPALVVAPTSVAFNWCNEVQRFAPTLNVRLFGDGDREAILKKVGPRDLVVCSYGLLHGEAELLQGTKWHTVVLDEAQAIKNVATRRSQAAMGLSADFRMILTGTPLENHLGELWNLFEFINPGLLGSLESFQERFAIPIERDQCRESRRRLKKLIQPFLLRRTKSHVLEELPSRTEVTLTVKLSNEESALYEALRQRAVEKLAEAAEDGQQHLRILAEIMRLRRACCHPKLVLEDCSLPGSKLALFSETLDELLANRHKVLVFSQFVDHLTILRDELDRKGVSYQYLDGSTPSRQRKQRVEAFQAGEGEVFLISLKAGGLGLNLTAADYVIHMDPWWNPAVEDQASDRAHRLGQTRPVTIYRFITQGTIEERILWLHASKRDLADSLLEGADISGKLSTQELLQLIRE